MPSSQRRVRSAAVAAAPDDVGPKRSRHTGISGVPCAASGMSPVMMAVTRSRGNTPSFRFASRVRFGGRTFSVGATGPSPRASSAVARRARALVGALPLAQELLAGGHDRLLQTIALARAAGDRQQPHPADQHGAQHPAGRYRRPGIRATAGSPQQRARAKPRCMEDRADATGARWGTPPWRVDVTLPATPLPARCDVAVVGGGFTGLSAGYHLARRGARVVVLEATALGAGASGRTGGIVLEGTAAGPLDGVERCLDALAGVVAEAGIDCDLTLPGCWELVHRDAPGALRPFWRDGEAWLCIEDTVPGGTIDPGALRRGSGARRTACGRDRARARQGRGRRAGASGPAARGRRIAARRCGLRGAERLRPGARRAPGAAHPGADPGGVHGGARARRHRGARPRRGRALLHPRHAVSLGPRAARRTRRARSGPGDERHRRRRGARAGRHRRRRVTSAASRRASPGFTRRSPASRSASAGAVRSPSRRTGRPC